MSGTSVYTTHGTRAGDVDASAGANVKALQRMLGHAKASMTLDVYADLFDDDLDGVAESLDEAIKSVADWQGRDTVVS